VTLKDRILEYNGQHKKNLLFKLNAGAGFYSEFNNMIFLFIYCLENKIKFRLQCGRGINFYNEGWADYFEAFFEEIKLPFTEKYNCRPWMRKDGRRFRIVPDILKKLYKIDYFTQDLWDTARERLKKSAEINIAGLDIKGNILEVSMMLIAEIYRFNNRTRSEIANQINKLQLPDHYAALHIRRGDKIRESVFVSEDLYFEHLQRTLNSCKNVFIMSDDYKAIERIKSRHKDFNIFHLVNTKETGYTHECFGKLSCEKRKEMIINTLANVDILSKADLFIGDFDSNLSMFVAMRRGGISCLNIRGSGFRII